MEMFTEYLWAFLIGGALFAADIPTAAEVKPPMNTPRSPF